MRALRSPLKDKKREYVTRSLDKLDDLTNLVRAASEHSAGTSGVEYSCFRGGQFPSSSHRRPPSLATGNAALMDMGTYDVPVTDVNPDACMGTADNTGDSCLTRARSVLPHIPDPAYLQQHRRSRRPGP